MVSLHKISEVLGKVQQDSSNHKKYLLILRNVYLQNEFNNFVKEFIRCLKHLLFEDASQNQNDFVANGLKFSALFSTSLHLDKSKKLRSPFLKVIILQVLELCNVSQTRYRVCLLINQLIQDHNESLETELFDEIREKMLERIQDVKPAVQVQAIEVLRRLQEPQNPNDLVIEAYVRCLCDRSAQVRKTIIRCIGVHPNTIPIIVKRCFDIDESVRFSVYEKLSEVPINMLKIEQRQHILANGLKDKNKNIQTLIQKTLLPHWLTNFSTSYFQLICALKLDADECDWKQSADIVEEALNIFFCNGDLKILMEILPLGPDKLITSSEIKWEELIYWRCLTNFLRQQDNATNYLDQVLPELSIFCTYIERVYKYRSACTNQFELMQHDQFMLELLQMANNFDFSDEIGRQNLYKLIQETLTDAKLTCKNVSLMVQIFEHLCPCSEERTNQLSGILYNIRNPWTEQPLSDYVIRQRNVEIAHYRVELNIAVDSCEQAIEKGDFISAAELQVNVENIKIKIKNVIEKYGHCQKIRVARNDVNTLSKCLDILIATLTSSSIKTTLPTEIRTLQEEFVQPLLISPQPEIYLKAMHFCGLACSIDENLALKYISLFCTPLISYKYMSTCDDEQAIILGISCITDIILLHGRRILDTNTQSMTNHQNCSTALQTAMENTSILSASVSFTNIVEILSAMLDDASPKIRERSCEALVKLMRNGTILSSVLLSKLILKWFNPATAKDIRLQQLLGGLFFEYITEVPGSLETVENAFIPTVSSVIAAPRHSPLANVSIESTLKFLIELCRPNRHKFNKELLNPHKNISFLLCREICDKPNERNVIIYLKALIMLDPPIKDATALKELRKLVDSMFELIMEKSVLTYVLKYKSRLESDMEQTISSTIDNNNRSPNISRSSSVCSNSDARHHYAKKSKLKV